ncbi:MAG: chitosanase [Labilithrix sp.]
MRALALSLIVLLAACSGANTPSEEGTRDGVSATTDGPTDGGAVGAGTSGHDAGASLPSALLGDALARHKAELLTSIWENGTTILQYGYCEDIDDGRGYTSGRAGFCSGTGDAVLVAKCVASAAPGAKIAKYVPALEAITKRFESTGKDQASTSKLDAVGRYCADWTADATGELAAVVKTCQDEVVEELYFAPARAEMTRYDLTSALALAALYDAEINHGDEGKDGVAELAAKAAKQAGKGDESRWLEAFLSIRLALLAGDETWAEAVDRVALYEQLRRDGNLDLTKPITTNAKAAKLFPGKKLKDSEYPSCTIAPDGAVSGDPDCTKPR